MTRDNNEIPAIFNPRARVRAPSVVVTNDSPNGSFAGGGFTNILHSSNPQISRSDSISQPNERNTDGNQYINATTMTTTSATAATTTTTTTTMTMTTTTTTTTAVAVTTTAASTNNNNTTTITTSNTPLAIGSEGNSRKLTKCKESCCSESAQKMYFGVCVTILVTASWVGATHCIKFLYVYQNSSQYSAVTPSVISTNDNFFYGDFENETNELFQPIHIPVTIPKIAPVSTSNGKQYAASEFNAPFFASWFCTNFVLLFYPIFLVGRLMTNNCHESPGEIFGNILRGFRDRGFTIGRFFNRCIVFCILWLITTYLYILSLRPLLATDAMSLFATNVASAYLLSWVILHEQFVGVRIVAVILCDTGIALLAYMDGITGSPTLGGVVLATISGAAYAVFKVMFRKLFGDPPVAMISFAFTIIGLINLTLCWPIPLGLYLSGTEWMPFESLFWIDLLIACILMLMFHILTQFSSAVTYSMFVTLGLITSVPVSAALDIVLYGANFAGMKLAGVILIAIGFFLVMFPNNWPDYITRLLRKTVRAFLRYQCCCEFDEIDYYHSKHYPPRAQCEMGEKSSKRLSFLAANSAHRLSDGLHTFAPTVTFRSSEMTESSSQTFTIDHPNSLQLIDRNLPLTRQYQRTLTATIVTANDDEFQVTTPTKRPRGNSVFEESLLQAGNYLRRKFSYGSSD